MMTWDLSAADSAIEIAAAAASEVDDAVPAA